RLPTQSPQQQQQHALLLLLLLLLQQGVAGRKGVKRWLKEIASRICLRSCGARRVSFCPFSLLLLLLLLLLLVLLLLLLLVLLLLLLRVWGPTRRICR